MLRILTALSIIYTSRLLQNNIGNLLVYNKVEQLPPLIIFENERNESIQEDIDRIIQMTIILQ